MLLVLIFDLKKQYFEIRSGQKKLFEFDNESDMYELDLELWRFNKKIDWEAIQCDIKPGKVCKESHRSTIKSS